MVELHIFFFLILFKNKFIDLRERNTNVRNISHLPPKLTVTRDQTHGLGRCPERTERTPSQEDAPATRATPARTLLYSFPYTLYSRMVM